ncbi:hypothetical protein GGG16DRAFT_118286 [Schizophyllum commune]
MAVERSPALHVAIKPVFYRLSRPNKSHLDGVSLRGRRTPKLIEKSLRVRPQTQNYRISTSNAPRPARESLADRREPIDPGEGGGALRRLVHVV